MRAHLLHLCRKLRKAHTLGGALQGIRGKDAGSHGDVPAVDHADLRVGLGRHAGTRIGARKLGGQGDDEALLATLAHGGEHVLEGRRRCLAGRRQVRTCLELAIELVAAQVDAIPVLFLAKHDGQRNDFHLVAKTRRHVRRRVDDDPHGFVVVHCYLSLAFQRFAQ